MKAKITVNGRPCPSGHHLEKIRGEGVNSGVRSAKKKRHNFAKAEQKLKEGVENAVQRSVMSSARNWEGGREAREGLGSKWYQPQVEGGGEGPRASEKKKKSFPIYLGYQAKGGEKVGITNTLCKMGKKKQKGEEAEEAE